MANKKEVKTKKVKTKEVKTKKRGRPKNLHQQLNTQFVPEEKEIDKVNFDVIEQVEQLDEQKQAKVENTIQQQKLNLEIKLSEQMEKSIVDLKTEEQTQRIIEQNIPKKIIPYYTFKDSDKQYKGKVYYQGVYYDSLQFFIEQFQFNNKKLPKHCLPVKEIDLNIDIQKSLNYLFKDNIKYIEQCNLKIITLAFKKFNECSGIFNYVDRDNYLIIKFKEQS